MRLVGWNVKHSNEDQCSTCCFDNKDAKKKIEGPSYKLIFEYENEKQIVYSYFFVTCVIWLYYIFHGFT